MKSLKMMAVAILAIVTTSAAAQVKTDSVKVYGECGMCKNRIQKTLKIDGVSKADWNADSKILVVTYDASKISNDEIQKKIAAVGHDTEKYMADENVYQKLPGCCHYDRKKAAN